MQAYVVCELQDKLNVLWAFIKAHLKVPSSCICEGFGDQTACPPLVSSADSNMRNCNQEASVRAIMAPLASLSSPWVQFPTVRKRRICVAQC